MRNRKTKSIRLNIFYKTCQNRACIDTILIYFNCMICSFEYCKEQCIFPDFYTNIILQYDGLFEEKEERMKMYEMKV